MCTYKGKQLGLGTRRGLWGNSLRASCESVLGGGPGYPTMSAGCLYSDCLGGRDGLPRATGAKGRPGDAQCGRGAGPPRGPLESVISHQNVYLIDFVFISFGNCQNSSSLCQPGQQDVLISIWVKVFNENSAKMAVIFWLSPMKVMVLIKTRYSYSAKSNSNSHPRRAYSRTISFAHFFTSLVF